MFDFQHSRVCKQSIKEHNLKANHNSVLLWLPFADSVNNLSKNTIWKQITTRWQSAGRCNFCKQSIKEHNLKANHNLNKWLTRRACSVNNLSKNTIWKQITTMSDTSHGRSVCKQSIKEHNLKANHNSTIPIIEPNISVNNLSKNTIWKQITTNGL